MNHIEYMERMADQRSGEQRAADRERASIVAYLKHWAEVLDGRLDEASAELQARQEAISRNEHHNPKLGGCEADYQCSATQKCRIHGGK